MKLMKRTYILISFLLVSRCVFACGEFANSVADTITDDVVSRLNTVSQNQSVDFNGIERVCEV